MANKHVVIDARESGTSTGRYIDKLIEHLHNLKPRYKITILTTPKRSDFMAKIAPQFNVKTTRVKEFGLAEQTVFLRQIKKLKPDLVHFGMTQQPILYRGKNITTMHDLTTARFRNPAKNWLVFTIKQQVYKLVVRIVARTSEIILTPSEYVKEDVARFARINSRKITVTYEAADRIADKPVAIEELKGRDFIMYVGRALPHKNLDRLLEAFVLLRQKQPELFLVLAGKKDILYRQLAKKARDKGIGHVVFTGYVEEGELKWLYEQARAYVFPSLSEGFGLPGIEAMVHGAPVVSSNATCLPEVYKDGALFFDPASAPDMAEQIGVVLGNEKLRSQLISRGKQIATGYSWQKMAEQTLEAYKTTMNDY